MDPTQTPELDGARTALALALVDAGGASPGTRKAVRAAGALIFGLLRAVMGQHLPDSVRRFLPALDTGLDAAEATALRELDELLGGDGDPTDEDATTSAPPESVSVFFGELPSQGTTVPLTTVVLPPELAARRAQVEAEIEKLAAAQLEKFEQLTEAAPAPSNPDHCRGIVRGSGKNAR